MKPFLAILFVVPHLAIFIGAGIYEYRRWQAIDSEDRPRFLDYLGRMDTPPAAPRTDVTHDKQRDAPANVASGTLRAEPPVSDDGNREDRPV